MQRNYEKDIQWFKKEAELHELAMQQNKDRMRSLEEKLHKSESDLAIAKGEAQRQFDHNLRLRKALDQIATVAELLIKEGSVHGPLSLHGCLIKARSMLANKIDNGRLAPKQTKSRTESERDVYKAAIDEMADNVAAVWQSGPAPKDGSWILGMFNGAPHVVYWDSWETGETIPGEGAYPEGHESGWVLARDTVVVMGEDEPERWARIIPPNRVQPAPWENEIVGGAVGEP